MCWSRFPKQKKWSPRNCSGFYKGIGTRTRHKGSLHPARQLRRESRAWGCLQAGRARHQIWVYRPQYSATKRTYQTQICYALWANARHDDNAMPKQGTNIFFQTEAADTATDLNNRIIQPGESQNSHQKFYIDKKKCFASPDNLNRPLARRLLWRTGPRLRPNCVTVARNSSG